MPGSGLRNAGYPKRTNYLALSLRSRHCRQSARHWGRTNDCGVGRTERDDLINQLFKLLDGCNVRLGHKAIVAGNVVTFDDGIESIEQCGEVACTAVPGRRCLRRRLAQDCLGGGHLRASYADIAHDCSCRPAYPPALIGIRRLSRCDEQFVLSRSRAPANESRCSHGVSGHDRDCAFRPQKRSQPPSTRARRRRRPDPHQCEVVERSRRAMLGHSKRHSVCRVHHPWSQNLREWSQQRDRAPWRCDGYRLYRHNADRPGAGAQSIR
jgi:hypothetical protein